MRVFEFVWLEIKETKSIYNDLQPQNEPFIANTAILQVRDSFTVYYTVYSTGVTDAGVCSTEDSFNIHLGEHRDKNICNFKP